MPITHPVGGIRTWCKYYYAHPRFRQFDIEILAPSSEECLELQRTMQPLNIPVRTTTGSLRSFALQICLSIASGRWDLVHAHGFTAAVISAPLALLFRRPCLVTQHEVILESQYRDLRGRLIRAAIRVALALVTRIHCVSESAADNLRKLVAQRPATCRLITVIGNGIDSDSFATAVPADLRAILPSEQHDFLVGFFGRFMNPKGFRILVEALRRLLARRPPIPRRPVVVAVGSGAFRAREERSIAALGLKENVRFIDFTPNVAGLIKGVDVVAVPSLWEACGLIAMEALVCGSPVICSTCDGLLEVTAGTPATLVPVGDPGALADALYSHMTADHRSAARAYAASAAERFRAAPLAARVASLYEELINGGR